MKRTFKHGLSVFEREQTERALAWQRVNLSERQRAGHRKQERELLLRALANIPAAALPVTIPATTAIDASDRLIHEIREMEA